MHQINLTLVLIKYFNGVEDEHFEPTQVARFNQAASNSLILLLGLFGLGTLGLTAESRAINNWTMVGMGMVISILLLWLRHLTHQLGFRELRTTRHDYAARIRRLRRRACGLGGGLALILWGSMSRVGDWRITLGLSAVIAVLMTVDTYQTWRDHLTIID
ncbi:hypothetical protein [Levilactobacillus acidifarinae]|uniref:Uncharacterized protein n=1 Tax=Levilactobacillus acidifarinae DSM 19394 = JCM 15949 TaxID=1423715 RepID=A0A0R1LLD2_9LACO|nr:hypothetical protein [Levilactobacillus acidifarinae]KRK96685.1 hypothetical protein FD25_GL001764 [Levilactobacillus acidifarinae DSM 19394]GEO70382.1 hypothetical protein LAC03_22920 [Levilactobacillus acidifarinae]